MSNEKTEADGVAIADQPLGLLDFATLPPLLDVGTVAALCGCSARHIRRSRGCSASPARSVWCWQFHPSASPNRGRAQGRYGPKT